MPGTSCPHQIHEKARRACSPASFRRYARPDFPITVSSALAAPGLFNTASRRWAPTRLPTRSTRSRHRRNAHCLAKGDLRSSRAYRCSTHPVTHPCRKDTIGTAVAHLRLYQHRSLGAMIGLRSVLKVLSRCMASMLTEQIRGKMFSGFPLKLLGLKSGGVCHQSR